MNKEGIGTALLFLLFFLAITDAYPQQSNEDKIQMDFWNDIIKKEPKRGKITVIVA